MEPAAYFIIALFSALVINYLADVLPTTRKLTRPACTNCQQSFTWIDYLLLRPCKNCGTKRSTRYLFVFIFIFSISLAVWVNIPATIEKWGALALVMYFGLVAVIDLEHRLILHPVSIVGAFFAAAIGYYLHGPLVTLIGGAAGFVFMLGLYYLGALFARWMAHRRGQELEEVALGFGDVNLAGICGLLLGWPGIIAGLVFAILLGGLASMGVIAYQLISKKYKPFSAIPYAPFLILGTSFLLFRALLQTGS